MTEKITSESAEETPLQYEQAFSQLEAIVSKLESGETTLDESVALFQKGMDLAKICSDKLAAIEHQISQLLIKDDGEVIEKPFGEMDV